MGGVDHKTILAAHSMGVAIVLLLIVANDCARALLLRAVGKEDQNIDEILQLKSLTEYGVVRTDRYFGIYDHGRDSLFGIADVKHMPPLEVDKAA